MLNYWYLPSSVKDGDEFEAELKRRGLSFYDSKPLPDKHYHRIIQESWNRIFDLDWTAPGITSPSKEKSIQATLWELSLNNVTRYDQFKAR